MDNIVIEKNIPTPSGKRHPKKHFPYAQLEVGDSFAVAIPEGMQVHQFSVNMRAHAYQWGRLNGAKFSVVMVDEQTKVLVWRVA